MSGAASALASDAFSMTMTNTCGRAGAALAAADGVGVTVGGEGVAGASVSRGAVAAGDAHARTHASTSHLHTFARIRTHSPAVAWDEDRPGDPPGGVPNSVCTCAAGQRRV